MAHPATRTWQLPPEDRAPLDLPRTNLRALAAREGRFEHHLVVVARIGDVQLEHATASEPLYFAHANVSDEYAMPLTTGDAMLDAVTFRVFLSDPERVEDVGRINHRANDLVLHPYGLLHWPGRLRPPFDPPRFPPGMRRAVHSLVMCASRVTPPVERPLFVSPGREEDAKAYAGEPPFLLAEIGSTAPGLVARVGHASLRVAAPPFAPARGGYVVVIDGEGPAFPCDLIYLPPGSRFEGAGMQRALLFSSDDVDAAPPPSSWDAVPPPPFDPFDPSRAGALPWSADGIEARAKDEREVEIAIAGASRAVPRYWLARMLFRLALHGFALGYVETYGGFYYDDRGERIRLGLRGASHVELARERVPALVESLYRAVAPREYTEDLR